MTFRRPRIASRWGHATDGEVVILDNRDSFVYNLAHRFEELDVGAVVVRSEAITVERLREWGPRALVLSPGPGHPVEAGISVDAVRAFSGRIPILGVCLGHQAIVEAFGGAVVTSGKPCHGMASAVEHTGLGLFTGLPNPFAAARYHSLIARDPLPDGLEATAWAEGFIMGLAHREHPTFGVQFHPESILTVDGYGILKNFCALMG